ATFSQMQAVIDALAAEWEAKSEAERAEREAERAEREAEREAERAEQAMALQVTTDRIDQLERRLFGRQSERRTKTPDAGKEARKRHRAELTPEEREARRAAAAEARKEKLDALEPVTMDLPLAAD